MQNIMSISRFLNFSSLFLCIFHIGGRACEKLRTNLSLFARAQKSVDESKLLAATFMVSFVLEFYDIKF